MQFKSLLQKEQIEKLRGLLFSKSEQLAISKIEDLTIQYSKYIKLNFVLVTLRTTVFFLIYSYISKLDALGTRQLYLILSSVFLLQCVSLYIDVFKQGYYWNSYRRVLSDILDNILSLVIADYRVSLAKIISTYPSPKNIATSLSEGVIALGLQSKTIASLLGIVLGSIVLVTSYIITGDGFSLTIALISTVSLILLLPYVYLGIKFTPKQKKLTEYVDNFDVEFKASQPLLFRSGVDLYTNSYEKYLTSVVSTTTIINFVTNSVSLLLPISILFISALTLDSSPIFSFILITTYIISNVFLTGPSVSYFFTLKTATERVQQLDSLIDTIYKVGSELTPKLYQQMSEEFLRINNDSCKAGKPLSEDYILSNVRYVSGREDSTNEILIKDMTLEKRKVNFLFGKSGIGKSLFGRLITLRYSSFEGDFVGLGNQDFRTFETLDIGLADFHFSGLRSISTSYRQAIGTYLRPVYTETSFREGLNTVDINFENVDNHFRNNREYYSSNWKRIVGTLKSYEKDSTKFAESFSALSDADKDAVTRCFRSKLDSEIPADIYLWALMAEYYTFSHLQYFIPEASLYFMDAILSEPPVSQGQRRRILFALDILIIGKVFVVDEPFSNLDNQVSKRILQSLIEYATKNDAVVVALDQEIKKKILAEVDSSSIGRLYEFTPNKKGYEITEILTH